MVGNLAEELEKLHPLDRAAAYVTDEGTIGLRINIDAGPDPDPGVEGAYLTKSAGREDARIRQEAQGMGLAPADPDLFADAAQALRQPHPAYAQPEQSVQAEQQQSARQSPRDNSDASRDAQSPDQEPQGQPGAAPGLAGPKRYTQEEWDKAPLMERAGNVIDHASAGRTWADDLGEWMQLERNTGPVSEAFKSIGRTGVAIFRGFAEGTKGFFQGLDDISTTISQQAGMDKGHVFEFLVKGSDYWVKQMDKMYDLRWDKRAQGNQIVSFDKFLNGLVGDFLGGAVPGMATFMTDLGGMAPLKGYAHGGPTGALTETAKVLLMDRTLKAASYLPYVLRAAGMGGLFAADAYGAGAQSIPELAAAAGTGAGFAAMSPRQTMPEVRRPTPFEAAQLPDWMFSSENVQELVRARKAGQISPAMEQMGRYFAEVFPERDAAMNLRVLDQLIVASQETMGAAGYQGKPGIIVGKASTYLEGGTLKAAMELYLGAGVDTVIHENGHLYFDRLSPEQKRPLMEWYQHETQGMQGAPVFTEWVVDRFTEYFMRNRLWERPASRADGFGGAFGRAANAVRTLIDRVRGVEGHSVPSDVAEMFRAAGTGESGDVFTFNFDPTPVESYQVKAQAAGTTGAKVYKPGDVVAKIDEAAAKELQAMGYKTTASNVVIPEKTIQYLDKKIKEGRLSPEDVSEIQTTVEFYDEVLPNIALPGKEYRASSVLFVKTDTRGYVVIVEATPGENNNPMWDIFKLDAQGGERYLKKFRKEKARRLESGGTASQEGAPSYSSQQADGQAGKPESGSGRTPFSGSQTESTSKENITPPEGNDKTNSNSVRPLAPEAQWENLRSWERVGDENRPWEIVEKADQASQALVKANFAPVFGQLADKAVNINLTRLQTPDDIKRVISEVGESLRPQMEEARRYVQTDSMVKQAAQEMVSGDLAGDLGMTESTLLQRQRGEAFSAEQALAARMILVSSAGELMRMAKDIQAGNNSNEILLAFRARMETHTAIQAQVSGMTAEAGRALRSFRILAGGSELAPGVKLNPKDIQHIIDQTGGRGDIERMAETLAVLAETGENSITQVNKAITEARSRTWKDWLFGYRYASMLSGIPTHLRNITGNALVAAMAIPERAVAHQLGVVSRFLGSNKPEHVELNEARALAWGYMQAQGEALKLAAMAFKTGESLFGPQQTEQAYRGVLVGETSPLEKVADIVWEAIQIPSRALGAEDEYFKAINYRAELGAQAYRTAATEGLDGAALTERARELMNNPSEDMQRRAIDAAKNRTFNDDLDGAMRHISKGLSASVVGKWFVPFVRTPYNIFKYTSVRTPLAPLFKGFRDDIAAGGARAELAMAQVIVGSSLMTLGASLAHMGVITGGGPSDPGERNVWLQNFQPHSVKIGENWYSYGNAAEPISTFLSLAADFHDAATHWKRDWDNFGETSVWELATAIVKAFSKNVTDKTFLKGVADLVHLLDDPDRYAEYILQSGEGSFVPAYLGNWANAQDPEVKMVGGFLDALLNRVPWTKSDLPARRNLWGEPILSTEVGPAVAWWSPIKVKGDDATEIDKEMLRLGMSVAMPKKEQGFRGVGVELTPEEYSRFMELSGQVVTVRRQGMPMTLKDHLNDYIASPAYQRLVEKSDGPDGFAALAIRDIIQTYQAIAREQLLEENPRIQDLVQAGLEEKRRQQ